MTSKGINLHIYPAPIVGESRIFRQTEAIEKSAIFDEVVICGKQSEELPEVEWLGSTRRIQRVESRSPDRPKSSLGRIADQLMWSVNIYRRWKRASLRVINAHSVAVLPLCVALARKTKAKLIYDTHELETETSTSKGFQRLVFKAIEQKYVRRADAIFVVNDSIATWYEETYPGVNVTAVTNAPLVGEQKQSGVDLRESLGLDHDSRLFVHVGNIADHRYIPEILETFAQRAHMNEHVVFLGAGQLEDAVKERSKSHENIHLHEQIPSEMVVPTLASCDIGICLIEPTCLSYALSLPNKAIEYTSAGIPFLYSDLAEVDRLLSGSLPEWKIHDVKASLDAALDGISNANIEEFKNRLQRVELPDWEQESSKMLSQYHEVLED